MPSSIKGASLIIPAVKNNQYLATFTDCITGNILTTVSAAATNQTITIPLPDISWDAAFTIVPGTVTALQEVPGSAPLKIYPNPTANGTMMIQYETNGTKKVVIDLYDLMGKKLMNMYSGNQNSGQHIFQWNSKSSHIPPGIYLLQLHIGLKTITEKIIITTN